MDKKDIDKKIFDKLEILRQPYKKDRAYNNLKQILNNNSEMNTIRGFIKSDVYDIYKGMYYIELEGRVSFDEINDRVENYKYFLNSFSKGSLILFEAVCMQIKDTDNLNRVIMYLSETDPFKQKLLLSNMARVDREGRGIIKYLKSNFTSKELKCVLWFLEDYNDYGKIVLDLVELLALRNSLESKIKLLEDAFDIKTECTDSEEEEKIINKKMDETFKSSKFFKSINVIKEFVRNEDNTEKKYYKDNEKEINGLEKALTLLNSVYNDDEITIARRIVRDVYDLDIKYDILKYIDEHNRIYHNKLDEEVERLKNSREDDYLKLLCNYNIDCNGFDITSLKHISLADLEEILKCISGYNFENNIIFYILDNSNIKRVKDINELVGKAILPLSFLNTNLDLFLDDSDKYNTLINNIDTLNNYDVNPKLFYNNIFILFSDNAILKRNLDILERYDLLKYIKTTDSFGFLIIDGLSEKIDLFLELGFERVLKHNIGLLNCTNSNRLYIINNLGIENEEEITEILNSNKFFILDSKIDSYISNGTRDDDKESCSISLEDLEEYRVGKRLYSLGDELISYNKVQSNINNGMSIYDSIFSNTHLSNDQINSIYDCLIQKKLVKKDNE